MELVKSYIVGPLTSSPFKPVDLMRPKKQKVVDLCEDTMMGPPRRTGDTASSSNHKSETLDEVSNSRVELSCSSSRLFDTVFGARSRPGLDKQKQDSLDIRIGTSGIPSELQDDIAAFKVKFSIKNLTGVSAGAMTHMVVQPLIDQHGKHMPRTFRTMLAVVQGIPIVEYRWVRDCVAVGKVLPTDIYLIRRDRVSGDGMVLALQDKVEPGLTTGVEELVCWLRSLHREDQETRGQVQGE